MINSINNNTNFNGTARFAQYGKDTIIKKTSKNTDRIIKAMADDMGKRGEMLSPVTKEKGVTFQRFIEMIFVISVPMSIICVIYHRSCFS